MPPIQASGRRDLGRAGLDSARMTGWYPGSAFPEFQPSMEHGSGMHRSTLGPQAWERMFRTEESWREWKKKSIKRHRSLRNKRENPPPIGFRRFGKPFGRNTEKWPNKRNGISRKRGKGKNNVAHSPSKIEKVKKAKELFAFCWYAWVKVGFSSLPCFPWKKAVFKLYSQTDFAE